MYQAYAGRVAGTRKVTFNVRVPEDVAQAIDKARAGQSRSAWVADAIDAALSGGEVGVASEGLKDVTEVKPGGTPKARREGCPHPRGRVIKGFCYACGKPAT